MPSKKKKSRASARMRPEYQIVADRLRQAREEAGLSQTALAAELEVPQSWVSKAETGERRLDVVEVFEVLDALGVSPNVFFRDLRRAIRFKD